MTVTAPTTDAEVPAFWQSLGLPGLIDVHTHFMPENVMRKVWAYFDRLPGEGWPLRYRFPPEERLAHLRSLGVRAFTSLLYPHRPDMAVWLNDWAAEFAKAAPDCVQSATFFPEPGVDSYVAEALSAGARVFKSHLQVGAYDPRDPLLRPVWRRLGAADVPVVIHCGSGPEPGEYTGPGPISEVLDEHPDLLLVIAHMGSPEYREFIELALRYQRVHLDTTLAFTNYVEAVGPFPRDALPVLVEHVDRIVLGTDYPNMPHRYAHQLEALVQIGFDDDWLRAVCYHNGARLLGV